MRGRAESNGAVTSRAILARSLSERTKTDGGSFYAVLTAGRRYSFILALTSTIMTKIFGWHPPGSFAHSIYPSSSYRSPVSGRQTRHIPRAPKTDINSRQTRTGLRLHCRIEEKGSQTTTAFEGEGWPDKLSAATTARMAATVPFAEADLGLLV